MNYPVLSFGLFLLVMAFFIFNSPSMTTPTGSPAPAQLTQTQSPAPGIPSDYCETVPAGSEITFNAPRDENTKCPDGPGGSYKSGGVDPDNIFGGNTTYKLIRRNVPLNRAFFTKEDNSDHSTLASDVGIDPGLDPAKYRLYFPQISGEISLENAPYSRTRDCGDRSYEHTGRMYFIDYGLAFALVLKDGQPIEVAGTAIGGGQSVFWLTDVFKDTEREDEIPPEAFACNTTTTTTPLAASTAPSQITVPNQQTGDADQLQLQYFIFGQPGAPAQIANTVTNGWVDSCKPAVYLYPKEKQLVNVKVFPKGELSFTDPPYNQDKGWTVWANPNGFLSNYPNSLPISQNYLYYESKLLDSKIHKPQKGWVVKPSELENLFNDILPKLGLNDKEKNDFMDYWSDKLPDSPYYFVGIIEKPQRDYLETLNVTPNPDTSIRFSLYFEALDKPKAVQQPEIQTPSREGFTLVDWGGMVKLHPNTPFTCSQ